MDGPWQQGAVTVFMDHVKKVGSLITSFKLTPPPSVSSTNSLSSHFVLLSFLLVPHLLLPLPRSPPSLLPMTPCEYHISLVILVVYHHLVLILRTFIFAVSLSLLFYYSFLFALLLFLSICSFIIPFYLLFTLLFIHSSCSSPN